MRLLGEWLESNSRRSGSKLVLAVDVVGPYERRLERALSLVAETRETIVAVKVNWHLLLPHGVLGLRRLVERCEEAGLPLIADVKLNDISSTNVEAAETLFSNGFDALIANPFVGYKEGMDGLLEKSREMGKAVVMLVYMSHAGAKEGYGMVVRGEPLYLEFARRTRRWGADGAIVSSKSPAVIRRVRSLLGKNQVILSPGVGFQGGDAKRAMAAGTDYIIVGRSIVGAENPARVVEAMNGKLAA